MNVSLTPELEQFVNQKVESGRYHTASEVVRDGLRLLLEREESHQKKLDELRREIAIAIKQADEGKVAPLDAEETLTRVRKKRQSRKDC
jgi:antitoxin ParD1/3/4